MTTTLLIDADVLCYQIAVSAEYAVNWADEGQPDVWTVWARQEETEVRFDSAIEALKDELGAKQAVLCLTHPDNWRLAVLPTYKSNRKDSRKPLLLHLLRERAMELHGAVMRPGLEGDDCLGILATRPAIFSTERRIIVTIDKDLGTVPGLHFNMKAEGDARQVVEITEAEADRFHLLQAMAGDKTDGYQGCPGIGMERAAEALDEMVAWETYEHLFKSGPRKGTTEMRWRKREARDAWDVVVSHYEKAGLTETDALAQARVARILRHSDWDYQKREPILWTPQH